MSSFAKRHNKQRLFDIDTTNFSYRKLSELHAENGANHVYVVRALYINTKSAFGDAPVVALDNCFVNLPAYMLDDVKGILSSNEDIAEIKAGHVGFTIREYPKKQYNRLCYGINWVDVDGENSGENNSEN